MAEPYTVRCRVHPEEPARLPSFELCSRCEQRLRAAQARLAAGQPLTGLQKETVQGIGKLWPIALQQQFNRLALRTACIGRRPYCGRDGRRGKAAYGMRYIGRHTWTEIADRLGYRSPQAAITQAKKYAARRDMPWPCPAGALAGEE